jgi:hypothetical protein
MQAPLHLALLVNSFSNKKMKPTLSSLASLLLLPDKQQQEQHHYYR